MSQYAELIKTGEAEWVLALSSENIINLDIKEQFATGALNHASTLGWELVSILNAGEEVTYILRREKKSGFKIFGGAK